MTLALWLATYLVHSTVVYGALLACRRPLGRLGGADRIWRAALLAPVVSATIGLTLAAPLWTLTLAAPADPALTAGPAAVSPDAPVARLALALTVGWVMAGLALLTRDLVAYRLFVRGLGTRRPVDPEVAASVSDVLCRAGSRGPIRLTHAPAAVSPMTLGRLEICLPSRLPADLARPEFRAVIAHEVAHISRDDGRWFWLAGAIQRLLFVQPLIHSACRELHYLSEIACDEWAAAHLADRRAMASGLVEVATWSRARRPAVLPGIVGRSSLGARVARLLDAPAPARRVPALVAWVLVAAVSLALPDVSFTARPVARGIGAALPQAFEARSREFIAGFEAGRRYSAARKPTASQPRVDRAGSAQGPGSWRADVERRLQRDASARGTKAVSR